MDVRVTGQAASAHHPLIGMNTRAQGLAGLQVVWMKPIGMTLLAEEGNRRDQQRALIRAMRRVAVQTVLAHRRMLEQEGSAFFRMALIARLVDGVGLQ